jgi:hypothetical protein
MREEHRAMEIFVPKWEESHMRLEDTHSEERRNLCFVDIMRGMWQARLR